MLPGCEQLSTRRKTPDTGSGRNIERWALLISGMHKSDLAVAIPHLIATLPAPATQIAVLYMEAQAMRVTLLRGGESSRAAQAAVDAGWAPLQAVATPQELLSALQQQQAACDAMLRCKDHVITAMREALAAAESDYVRTLQAHAEARAWALCMSLVSKENHTG